MKDDLKQYITNCLYYVRDKVYNLNPDEFDAWVESQINGIDEYFESQSLPPVSEEEINAIEFIQENPNQDDFVSHTYSQTMYGGNPSDNSIECAMYWQKEMDKVIKILSRLPQREVSMPLGLDNPYPLKSVLEKLIEATEILLHQKSYDGPNYEELEMCVRRAKEIIRQISIEQPIENPDKLEVEQPEDKSSKMINEEYKHGNHAFE